MKSLIRSAFCLWLAVGGGISLAQTEGGSGYPSKALRMVVPFSAGGGNDIIGRLIASKLTESFGRPVVVENRPGAEGSIGAELVAKSAPDGHTMLMGSSGPMAIGPAIYSRLPYATLRDFAPVTMLGAVPLILVVSPSLPVHTVGELVQYAKSRPNQVNYGSTAASFRLVSELFNVRTATSFLHIPYKGSADFVNAVMSGEVTMAFADPTPATGPLKSGKIRGLAVTSAQRHPAWPELPTMAEAGVPDMAVTIWLGLFVPAATPSSIVRRLRDEVAKALSASEIRERMTGLNIVIVGNQPEEFAKLVASDIDRWTAIAKAANIKAD